MSQESEQNWRPRIGLALGSGVARGWAHIGVLRALARCGIKPDIISGTSIGAVVGASYITDELDTLEEWARSITKLRMLSYMDFKVSSGGLIGGRHLVDVMKQHLGDAAFEDFETPFVAVATDLVTGHEVWLREGHLVDAVRASFSLPGVFQPTLVDDRWVVDGALVNPVPVSVCQALGAQMIIAVNLNADIIGKSRQPGGKIATVAGFDLLEVMNEGAPASSGSMLDALARRTFRREANQPSLFGVMISSLNIVQDRIARSRLAGEPPDVHITPRLGQIGLFEFHRADEIIAEGEAAVERVLPDLRDALAVFATGSDGF